MGKWPPTTDQRFVYDQWNVIMAMNGRNSDAVSRFYTWGLDLSGQSGQMSVAGMQGAGGLGGLLAARRVDGTRNWTAAVNESLAAEDLEVVRTSTSRGCPLDDADWAQSTARRWALEFTL